MKTSSHSLDGPGVACDDPHAVANVGLLQPATLAQRLGPKELIEDHLDLGKAPGRRQSGGVGSWGTGPLHSGDFPA